MVYFNCEKKVRAARGKLRFGEVLFEEQHSCNLKIWFTGMFQASLPGIFFENSESARHEEGVSNEVSGIRGKNVVKKEASYA